ncbi:MAG TPA: tetratricopeptide repeat protein [Candidatus Baltobacteraceae bacterium]
MEEHGIDVRVPFVGRTDQVELALALLPAGGILTLLGTGGCGKSRLALEIARQFADDDFVFVPLLEVASGALDDALAAALNARESAGESALDGAVARLRSRPRLVLLDNAEHVLQEAKVAAQALCAVGGAVVLVTSRRRLDAADETVIEVGPMSGDDAREFFRLCARTRVPDFQPNARELVAVDKIVDSLDGLPFAIDLAAARYPASSLSQLVEMTRHIVPSQLTATTSSNSRHWTLQRTIDWSTSFLSDNTRNALGFLTMFNGRFDREDAREVCAPNQTQAHVDAILDELADHSLLVRTGDDTFAMLAPTRAVARQLISRMQDRRVAAKRFALRMRERAIASRDLAASGDGPNVQRLIAQRYADYRAVLEWSLKNEDRLPIGADIAGALVVRWADGGHLTEGMVWTKRLTDAAEEAGTLDSYALARLWYGRIRVCVLASDYATLLEHVPFLVGAFTQANDRLSLGRAYNIICVASLYLGDLETAISYGDTALRLHRTLGHQPGVGAALCNLGSIALELQNDPASALDYYAQAQEAMPDGNPPGLYATLLGNRAEALTALGDYPQAAAVARQGMEVALRLENAAFQAWFFQTLARGRLSQGDREGARNALENALDRLEVTPQPEYLAGVSEAIARYALDAGEAPAAARLLRGVERYRERFRIVRPGPAVEEARQTAARARELLSPERWDEAVRAGDRIAPAELRSAAKAALHEASVPTLGGS